MFARLPRGLNLLFATLLAVLVTRTVFGCVEPKVPHPLSGAAQSADGKEADQEVLKMNEECNAAELRGDVAAMDSYETDDFTHTHAKGTVEHKAEYLKGVGSGVHKERYRGTAVWNRTRKARDPRTGRRIQRLRRRTEWTVIESPHLRIVSDEIWQEVRNRFESVNAAFSSGVGTGLALRDRTRHDISSPAF